MGRFGSAIYFARFDAPSAIIVYRAVDGSFNHGCKKEREGAGGQGKTNLIRGREMRVIALTILPAGGCEREFLGPAPFQLQFHRHDF